MTISTLELDQEYYLRTLKRVYLSGKMSGLADHGFSELRSASRTLKSLGYAVFDPSETDNGDTSSPRPYYLRKDLKAIIEWSEAVVVIDNWKDSAGAILEVHVAVELELPVISFKDLIELKTRGVIPKLIGKEEVLKAISSIYALPGRDIADEAYDLVRGDRNKFYGRAYDDFTRIATMWTGVLLPKLKPGQIITAKEVGLMMVCVKVSREVNMSKRDNYVDIVGYTYLVEDIAKIMEEEGVVK